MAKNKVMYMGIELDGRRWKYKCPHCGVPWSRDQLLSARCYHCRGEEE